MGTITRVQRKFIASEVDPSAVATATAPFKALASTAVAFADIKQRQEQTSAKAEVAKTNAAYTRNLETSFRDNKTQFKNDPTNGLKDFESKMNTTTEEFLGGMNTDTSRQLMQQSSDILKQQYLAKHETWSAGQIKKNVLADLDTTAASYSEQSYEAGKEASFDEFLRIQAMSKDIVAASSDVVGSEEDLVKLNDTMAKENATRFLAGLTREDPVAAVNVLDSNQLGDVFTTEEKDALKDLALRTAQTKIKADLQLRRDRPLAWLEKQGETAPDIEIGDPTTAQERADWVEVQRAAHPEMDIPMFKQEEVDGILNAMRNSNPEQMVQQLQTLSISSPEGFIDDIAEQVFKKSPTHGIALSVVAEDTNLSEDIIRGQKIVDEKTLKLPNQGAVAAAVNARLKTAIQDPALLGQINKAVTAAYASGVFKSGSDSPEDIDDNSEIFEDVLRRTVGDVAEINDVTTVTFRDASNEVVTGDDFEDKFDDLTDADFFQTGQELPFAGAEQVNAAFVREWGKLVAIGDGDYQIQISTNQGVQFLTNQDGTPYEFDFKGIFNAGQVIEAIGVEDDSLNIN